MRIEQPIPRCTLVVRHEDFPSPIHTPNWPDTRFDVTLILPRESMDDDRFLDAIVSYVCCAGQMAFLATRAPTASPVFQPRDVRPQVWPIHANKGSEGRCLVVDPGCIYHYSPDQILAVQVLFAHDADWRMHARITVGQTLATGVERDRPAQPSRHGLASGGSIVPDPDRWRLLYPELSASLHGGSDSPHVHTLWLNLKDDPTDPVAWDAFADAMEEEGIYTPTRERQAARLIREGLLLGCTPVGPGQRHPGLLWPGQAVKP